MGHQSSRVVIRVQDGSLGNFPEIAEVGDPVGSFFRLAQRREQHRRENRDDGNDHQEFDQRKGAISVRFMG